MFLDVCIYTMIFPLRTALLHPINFGVCISIFICVEVLFNFSFDFFIDPFVAQEHVVSSSHICEFSCSLLVQFSSFIPLRSAKMCDVFKFLKFIEICFMA